MEVRSASSVTRAVPCRATDDPHLMQNLKRQKSLVDDETENESRIYKTVEFRMFCFKVLPCSKRFCHDWTNCPFAHPGEKARRRDPRLFRYKGIACPEMKMGRPCPRGSACPFAHNVFEYWLHPNRYRTQPCNDGPACARKVCFFAHTLDELRVPTEEADNNAGSPSNDSSDLGEVDPSSSSLESTLDVEQHGTDASCELTEELGMSLTSPFSSHLAWKGNGLGCLRRSDSASCPTTHLSQSTSVTSQQTYFMSSLASSSLLPQWMDADSRSLANENQQQPHHLEKALTDLINYGHDSDLTMLQHQENQQQQQQQRMPLASFNLQNYDTSALESGLHWNGGPPKLFVERGYAFSNSLTTSLHSTLSSDVENVSGEPLDSIVISKSAQPFILGSQLSNFGGF